MSQPPIVPTYDVPTFPDWAVDLAARVRHIGEAIGESFDEDDDEDRYEGPMFVGMILRPAMTSGGKTVGWRLATVDEAKAWNEQYPRWRDLVCVCGHVRDRHRNLWADDDNTIIGEDCEDCECATVSGRGFQP